MKVRIWKYYNLDEVDKNLDPVYPTTVLGQLALVIAEIETRPTLGGVSELLE